MNGDKKTYRWVGQSTKLKDWLIALCANFLSWHFNFGKTMKLCRTMSDDRFYRTLKGLTRKSVTNQLTKIFRPEVVVSTLMVSVLVTTKWLKSWWNRTILIHVAMRRNLEGWTFVIISECYGKIAHWAMWDWCVVIKGYTGIRGRTRQI